MAKEDVFQLIITDVNGIISYEIKDFLTKTKTEFPDNEMKYQLPGSLPDTCKEVIKQVKNIYRGAVKQNTSKTASK